jgi:hypothetical protein
MAEDFERGLCTETRDQGKDLQIFYANRVTVGQLIGLFLFLVKRQSNVITGLDRPWWFQEIEGPRLLDIRKLKAGRLSASHTGRSKTVTRYH